MTVQRLYDYCKINNCLDQNICINIIDRYHDSEFFESFSLKDVESIENELNIKVEVNK